jgi:hypothetical protein
MRLYAMRGAVPVSFAAHLLINAVTRQVSALNPALRIPPTVIRNLLFNKMLVDI